MLQILSTSNETSTSTELVQNGNFSELGSDLILNGDFAEIGSDLVTNGDFSATGSNLVSNPNFTDTGSELITNGDFATDTDWVKEGLWEISGGSANRIAEGVNSRFYQVGVVEALKSYKLTFSISAISAGAINQVTLGGVGISGTWNTAETFTLYFTTVNTASCSITGDATFAGSIDNVSVKELGSDWDITNADATHYVEFIETGARFVLPTTSPIVELKQTTFQLLANKSYKLTVDMTRVSGSVKVDTSGVSELFDATTSGTNNTRYITPTGNMYLTFYRQSTPTDITFHSISVQELGEGWTLGTSWSIGDGVATLLNGTGATDSQILSTTVLDTSKSYVLKYTISNFIEGQLAMVTGNIPIPSTDGNQEVYFTNQSHIKLKRYAGQTTSLTITNITVQEVGQDWTLGTGVTIGEDKAVLLNPTAFSFCLTQTVGVTLGKYYKVIYEITDRLSGSIRVRLGSNVGAARSSNGVFEEVIVAQSTLLIFQPTSADFNGSITNISVQELDPNGYWTLGTGWSIGADKAISTVTGSNSDITQSILTAGKTYRTVYEIVDYTAGTAQAIVTGSDGADAVALGTYTEDLTTTGTDFSIRSKLGTFDGAVSSVSVKQLGTYEDQSIYVTAADVQTIPQASVYYLVELTSMGSKNSLYFIPSSVVPNNGRYTKLNFTVISKDALPQPTVGIISFYDSVGGLDTYPMGFYEFRIYEQTSSTNLDPLLATGLLEKGFAFVRDFSGNMQELTDGFKEYNPALTQYVYSK